MEPPIFDSPVPFLDKEALSPGSHAQWCHILGKKPHNDPFLLPIYWRNPNQLQWRHETIDNPTIFYFNKILMSLDVPKPTCVGMYGHMQNDFLNKLVAGGWQHTKAWDLTGPRRTLATTIPVALQYCWWIWLLTGQSNQAMTPWVLAGGVG